MIHVGTAGWAIRREHAPLFPGEGSHLERYAARLNAVEINSSFYRPHRAATYARWAASVPEDFRFAVKLPRAVTHERRLVDTDALLDAFLAQAGALGEKLGPLLVQLPPSLAFEARSAHAFLKALRARFDGLVACEPRHASWFEPRAEALLAAFRVARVAADPAIGPFAPAGAFEYWRLHGSPKIYCSDYDDAFLKRLAERLGGEAWCIFDKTALGHAVENALTLCASAATCRTGPRRASRSR
jgi:uncharacterized protein YecE (DUF72 family)